MSSKELRGVPRIFLPTVTLDRVPSNQILLTGPRQWARRSTRRLLPEETDFLA